MATLYDFINGYNEFCLWSNGIPYLKIVDINIPIDKSEGISFTTNEPDIKIDYSDSANDNSPLIKAPKFDNLFHTTDSDKFEITDKIETLHPSINEYIRLSPSVHYMSDPFIGHQDDFSEFASRGDLRPQIFANLDVLP